MKNIKRFELIGKIPLDNRRKLSIIAQGSGLRAQGSGLRAQGSGLRAQGSGLILQLFFSL
jgi:hypothetical protein